MTKRREPKDWESWIDEQIREAQEKGQFDNLPGKGKPLELASNAYAGDREMAFKILRDAGYAPEWIELDKAIRVRLERARAALARAWEWYRESTSGLAGAPQPEGTASARPRSRRLRADRGHGAALAAWQAAADRFQEEVASINVQIAELNLKVPSPVFQRSRVDAGQDVQALTDGLEDGAV